MLSHTLPMGLFNKLLPNRPPPLTPREDSTFGFPGAKMAMQHAKQRDWRKIRDVLARETNHSRRHLMMSVAVNVPGSDDWVLQWLNDEPLNADAWVVGGFRAIMRGWEIRGGAKADDVPEERWDSFHACLEDAVNQLAQAADMNKQDPVPLALWIIAASALSSPVEDRLILYEAAKKRSSTYHGADTAAVGFCAEKWGGSHELMFKIARAGLQSAPPGTGIPLAMARAHVERWLYYMSWENNKQAVELYFKTPSVGRDIRAAYEKAQGAEQPMATMIESDFAFCFWKMGDRKAAKQALTRANGIFSSIPWDYAGGIHAMLKAVRECF